MLVQDHLDGNRDEEVAETALVEEPLEKAAVLQGRENLRRDASTEIDATPREDLQREVARLGSVYGGEQVKRPRRQGGGALDSGGGDDGGPVLLLEGAP